jgi:hypothetical protein
MELTSAALRDGEPIPLRYTKDGENLSPPLRWSGLPEGARELVLFCENITPETQEPFVQWLVYGIGADARELPEGYQHKAAPEEPLALRQGRNDIGNVGYDGPLGSVGKTVRYRFRLLAVDRELGLAPGEDKQSVGAAISRHVLDEAALTVVHERQA